MQFLKPYTECIHDTVRIVAGVLFFQHGAQKIFGILGMEESVALGSRLGLAGIIEMTTGALIALGLFTPIAAFIASGEMAVAFFIARAARQHLAHRQPGRAGRALLLPVPVPRQPRFRRLEPRPDTEGPQGRLRNGVRRAHHRFAR